MADMLIVALRGAGRLMTANREGVFYLRLCGRSRSSCRSRCRCFCRCRFGSPTGSRSTGARLLRLSRLAGGVVLLISVLSGRGGRCRRSGRRRCGSYFWCFRNRSLTLARGHIRTRRIVGVFLFLQPVKETATVAAKATATILFAVLTLLFIIDLLPLGDSFLTILYQRKHRVDIDFYRIYNFSIKFYRLHKCNIL